MRPTTHDIARVADVSLATVDRVLNDRPGVSPKTHAKVNAAIKELGYIRDVSAANLAKKRQYRIIFFLPYEESQFLDALIESVEQSASHAFSDRMNIKCVRFPANDPHALVDALRKAQRKKPDGIAIMAAETPHVRDAISDLKQKGIAVVALVSDQPDSESDHFIGINNIAAGRTAAVLMGRFLPSSPGKIIVLTNSMLSRDSVDRRLGFDEIMQNRFPHLDVLPTLEGHGENDRIQQVLGNAFASNDNIIGLYSMSSGNRDVDVFLQQQNKPDNMTVIAHELTERTKASLHDGTIDAVITQNTGHIVRSALRVLRAKSDGMPIDNSQERIRIEIVLRENLS